MKIFTGVSIFAAILFILMGCQAKTPSKRTTPSSGEVNRAPAGSFQGREYYNESKPVESHPVTLDTVQSKKH